MEEIVHRGQLCNQNFFFGFQLKKSVTERRARRISLWKKPKRRRMSSGKFGKFFVFLSADDN
jgi:hypothetical protein